MPQQTWRCPRCNIEYQSPIRIFQISCNNRHPYVRMDLVVGSLPPEKNPPKKETQPVHSSKPKASRATLDRVVATMKQVEETNG